jgi:hypothetical protein
MIGEMDEQDYRNCLRDAETTSDDIAIHPPKDASCEQSKHALGDSVIRKENEFIFFRT